MADRVNDYLKKHSDSFCVYPFTHVSFGQGGRINLCCRADFDRKDNLGNIPSDKVWNSDLFTRVRRQMLKGEKPSECQACWQMEESKVISYRQEALRPNTQLRDWFEAYSKFDEETGIIESGVQSVKVYLSNLCNLRCRMCNPEHSTRWETLWKSDAALRQWFDDVDYHDGAYEAPTPLVPGYEHELLAFIKKNVSELKEINFVGGEPLIQKEHYEVLDYLKGYESGIDLYYDTNMTSLTMASKSALHLWAPYKSVQVYISIDGPPAMFEYIRPGLKAEKVEENISQLMDAFKLRERRSNVNLWGSCTFSAYNTAFAPEAVEYITTLGLGLMTSYVQSPYFVSSQTLPLEEKQKITEKITKFMNNPSALDVAFSKNSIWNNPDKRKDQLSRVQLHMTNAINFMNGADESKHFEKFLTFDSHLSRAGNSASIYTFYPEWKKYEPQGKPHGN